MCRGKVRGHLALHKHQAATRADNSQGHPKWFSFLGYAQGKALGFYTHMKGGNVWCVLVESVGGGGV